MNHPDDLTLQAWHDGELDDARREETAAHVASCAQCEGKTRALQGLSRAVSAWEDAAPALPDDFADLLLAKVEKERPAAPVAAPQREPARVIPMRRWFYPALAAAAAGIIAVGVAIPRRPRGTSALEGPVVVGEGVGGAKVTRVDVPGAQSFTVMQLPGVRPDSVTAVVWIQDRDESGGSP